MLKDNIRKQTVWFKAKEELQILNWLENEIDVALAPNMAIRYLCMKALQDKKLRKRATERINLMFEENAQKGRRKQVKCCEACTHIDFPGKELNAHRVGCEIYQALVKERMNKLIMEAVIKA